MMKFGVQRCSSYHIKPTLRKCCSNHSWALLFIGYAEQANKNIAIPFEFGTWGCRVTAPALVLWLRHASYQSLYLQIG